MLAAPNSSTPDSAARLYPRTGSLLADMILDGRSPEVLAPFSPARFGA